MKRLNPAAVAAVFLVLTCVASAAVADLAKDQHSYLNMLARYRNEASSWQRTAALLIALNIAVFGLGLASGALNRFNKRWCRNAAIAAGLIISVLTYVNNRVFSTDYRQLRRTRYRLNTLINSTERDIVRGYDPGRAEERREWISSIGDQFHEMDVLCEEICGGIASLGTISGARASVVDPDWIETPPEDPARLFFVGVGEHRSLAEAKKASFLDAVEGAARFWSTREEIRGISEGAGLDLEALAGHLASSAKTNDTFYRFDTEHGLYRFFTLVSFSRRSITTDVRIFAVQQGVSAPADIDLPAETYRQSSRDYYTKRLETTKRFLDTAADDLDSEDYSRFMSLREMRRAGRCADVIVPLREFCECHPEFFMGWYNLALAYDDLGDDRADATYCRAVELEPAQEWRDASVYNSYGWFLYRNARYAAAKEMFIRALEIDPGHPKARRNLRSTERVLGQG